MLDSIEPSLFRLGDWVVEKDAGNIQPLQLTNSVQQILKAVNDN